MTVRRDDIGRDNCRRRSELGRGLVLVELNVVYPSLAIPFNGLMALALRDQYRKRGGRSMQRWKLVCFWMFAISVNAVPWLSGWAEHIAGSLALATFIAAFLDDGGDGGGGWRIRADLLIPNARAAE